MSISFGERLKEALDDKGWEPMEYEFRTGFSRNRIENWIRNDNEPDNLDTLRKIAEAVERPVDWLIGVNGASKESVVTMPKDKEEATRIYTSIVEDFIKTSHTLWIQSTTGNTLRRQQEKYEHLILNSNIRKIRVLLSTPIDSTKNEPSPAALCITWRRDIQGNVESVINDIQGTIEWFEKIAKDSLKNGRKLDLIVKTTPYFFNCATYFSNPHNDDARVVLLSTNFQDTPLLAPQIQTHKSSQAKSELYNFYFEDFKRMWRWEKTEQIYPPLTE